MSLKKEKRIKIYADENVNVAIVEGLRRRGVEAWSAIDKGKLGLSDEEQLRFALEEKATIFTHDDDFLSMATESGIEHFGIIYVHQQHFASGGMYSSAESNC
jgi:predicted nuclease of predicted toxin-antitoxin system